MSWIDPSWLDETWMIDNGTFKLTADMEAWRLCMEKDAETVFFDIHWLRSKRNKCTPFFSYPDCDDEKCKYHDIEGLR